MASETPLPPPPRDDQLTVAAIAIAAAAIVTFDHEALGHGSACLASGGHIALLTSVYFRCTTPSAWIAAGGPAGNLIMGAAAWLALQTVPARMARLRLLLMLITALGVFWEAGYLLYSMMRSDGDWFFAARAAFGEPAWPWQIGGAVTGLVLYLVGMRATAAATRALVGADESSGRRRARALLRTAWIAASVSACVAAAAYAPDRLGAMRQASLEIGAGSLPLLMLARRIRPGSARMEMPLSRHFGWIVFAVVLYAVFVATLGRGI